LYSANPAFGELAGLDVLQSRFIRFLTLASMILGPTLTSPHLAVSEIEKRMPLMPASFINPRSASTHAGIRNKPSRVDIRLDEHLVTACTSRTRAAAQHSLFAEQIRFGFFLERGSR